VSGSLLTYQGARHLALRGRRRLEHMQSRVRQIAQRVGTRLAPARLRAAIFKGAFRLMPEWQRDQFRRTYEMASVECSLRNMRALGFRPRRIVDVGAYVGDWTCMVKGIFPDASVLMVEAQPSKQSQLLEVCEKYPGEVQCRMALLGPEACAGVRFYELETGSSVLWEQSNVARREIRCEMRTLDGLLSGTRFGSVDFLKLDVQGYELEVLKGAEESLRGIQAILMEVSLLRVNKGAPLLHEVLRFMDERGFRAYDICSFIRRPLDNALWQSDVIFMRVESPLLASECFN